MINPFRIRYNFGLFDSWAFAKKIHDSMSIIYL